MKRGRLPLTALRSFEAAGRHLSFSRAADELFVSQAAISRQIRELEQLLGTRLFERLHRKVVLTDAGALLLVQIIRSFDTIDGALTEITAGNAGKTVRVSVEPALASAWLVQRLDRFRKLHPDIDLLVDVNPKVISFHAGGPELAIRYSGSKTSWPDTDAQKLVQSFDTPMLSPKLRDTSAPIAAPDDLRMLTLLHEENRQYWDRWFAAADAASTGEPVRGPLLADMALVLQAAVRGHGVALGCTFLAGDDLAAGTLVAPFDTKIASGAYWLCARDLGRLSESGRLFSDWIKAEFSRSSSITGEHTVTG